MPELSFAPMDESGFGMLEEWFRDDELSRWVSRPTPEWLGYVRCTPGVFAWMVFETGSAIGHIQMDVATEAGARIGYVGFLTRPDLRNLGHGRRMLGALAEQPEASDLDRLVAKVEPDNHASQRCLLAAGWQRDECGPDEDGFHTYVRAPE